MSLASLYQAFLVAPQASALAEDASLHYVTTLTSVHEVPKIVKQLTATHLKKREQNVIELIEGSDKVFFQVETTLEFISSGGAYLPGLDDNFLSDRVVTLPMTHVVHFNAARKIQQIRISWDQGTLLKNLDVIGARGKNWPIRDGPEQARLIKTGLALAAKQTGDQPREAVQPRDRPVSPSKRQIKDPHASLSLFGPREDNEDKILPAAVAPRASAKPPPRDYHDLFVGNESDQSPASTKAMPREITRPSNEEPVAPKIGAGKNYRPIRLFDQDENPPPPTPATASKNYKPSRLFENEENSEDVSTERVAESAQKANPKKYEHFEFADEPDQPLPSPVRPKSKHGSQWDFEDFVTPSKPALKVRGQDVRHFSWSDDEVAADSPMKQKVVHKPRRDAETHFEFVDDGTPEGEKRPAGVPRGTSHNNGLGLYQNNVYSENGNPSPAKQAALPLGNVTNIAHRRKDFDSQFVMADESPGSKEEVPPKHVPSNRQAAVKMMNSNWNAYDPSAAEAGKEPAEEKKENIGGGGGGAGRRPTTGIATTGDGMGGKKGTGRQWGIGDDSDAEGQEAVRKGVPGKKLQQQQPGAAGGEKSFWDF